MRHSSVLAVLIAVIALVPLTASATTSRSDARTAWDRISGPTQPSVQLGLARTKDGVLHAISNSNAHVRCSFLGRSTDGRSGSDLRRLTAALGIFENVRSELWAERTRAELQRVATRQAPATLTPTERQIAQLAADGLTNKGIAARMFVSAKTVEANLSRVYRKLGISARTQLGRALAEAQE